MKEKIMGTSDSGGKIIQSEQALPKPKEVMGVEGSIFGPEKSEAFIKELLERYRDDKRNALLNFMEIEVRTRAEKASTEEGKLNWDDAINIYAARSSIQNILEGRDVTSIREELQRNRDERYWNIAERETIAQIYFAARRKIFHEAPFPEE